jgi:GT2 family glycosyltransferase
MIVTGSIVLYNNDCLQYSLAINSFLQGCNGSLYVIDNSPVPIDDELFRIPRIIYKWTGKNIGFGAAHNIAIKLIEEKSDVHIFLNPDIFFGVDVIGAIAEYMRINVNVGAAMPKILYKSGEVQRVAKLLPTPVNLIFRRFIPENNFTKKINNHYELHTLADDKVTVVPSLSGCFLACRTSLLQKLNGFDERFFMYLEDIDLVRRIGDASDTIYFPHVSVFHGYQKGSYKSGKLLLHHISSAIQYFNKWGWYFDDTRKIRNEKITRTISREC